MMGTRVLIVEDDEDLVLMLKSTLQRDGYEVSWARDGVEAIQQVQAQRPSLVLLDLMLPRMDGWEVCRRIREDSTVPILMVTAYKGDRNVARGLDLGADDYIIKPFSMLELRARIRAALRRSSRPPCCDITIRIDDRLTFDRAKGCLTVDGRSVELSAIECKLLCCFLDSPDRILSHQSLLTQVWGWECIGETQWLKVYIYRLRKKIEENPRHPDYILTERGLGYIFRRP